MKLLKNIQLKYKNSDGEQFLNLKPTGMTIFVGPNNSGKSLALREIEQICFTYQKNNTSLINNIEFSFPDLETIEKDIKSKATPKMPGEKVQEGSIIVQRTTTPQGLQSREAIFLDNIRDWYKQNNIPPLARFYISLLSIRLDGSTRTNLLQPQPLGDLLQAPTNILASLWVNSKSRATLRKLIYEAFNEYFTIDALQQHQLRARLSKKEPADEEEEQALSTKAIEFHKNSKEIMFCSDGVKAYTGILANVLGHNSRICLIDEPEAFLHPPLARRLGKELSNITMSENANVVVATHSSEFLMGCIQSGTPINVVRLTYKNNFSSARILPEQKILPLMRNPLLRSTGVLAGLFYESVVVTEADADRAFYQEINERLLAQKDNRGIPNCLFLNAQNKQTVWDIVKPLRELGIPAIGIVDFDVFTEGGTVWTKPLEGGFIPERLHESLHLQRQSIVKIFETKDDLKKNGMSLLENDERLACEHVLSTLSDYGVMIVPVGEVEKWLPSLNISRGKQKWLINIFEKMGDSPDQENYLQPTNGDVWDFIGLAKKWLENENRKGIPPQINS